MAYGKESCAFFAKSEGFSFFPRHLSMSLSFSFLFSLYYFLFSFLLLPVEKHLPDERVRSIIYNFCFVVSDSLMKAISPQAAP
jgi:hypothetical protein